MGMPKTRGCPKRCDTGPVSEDALSMIDYLGAIHSTKISGNFSPKLNGLVRSNRKSFEKTGPPFEVDHFSRSDRLEFWLNGSRPLCVVCVWEPDASYLINRVNIKVNIHPDSEGWEMQLDPGSPQKSVHLHKRSGYQYAYHITLSLPPKTWLMSTQFW